MANAKGTKCVKRTYTLSADTSSRFESLVPPGERSQVVETLLRREIDEMGRRRLRDAVAEGLADMAGVNAQIAREWSAIDSEAWPSE